VIESAVVAVLKADPAVAALIGTRVYPLNLPQSPTLPAITYQRISDDPGLVLSETSDMQRVRIELDSFAATFSGARALDLAAMTTLHGYACGLIQLIRALNGLDIYDEETKTYRVTRDYYVTGKG
jgi:hypothetical protein